MSKEGLTIYQAQVQKIDFIEKAVAGGVLERIPVSERDQNIAIIYTLNEEVKGKDIGEIFPKPSGKPLSKQRIDQIYKKFCQESLHASPQLQASYSLDVLLMRKPYALSERNVRIKQAVERGVVNLKSIKNKKEQRILYDARKTLLKRGIEIPFIPTTYQDLKAKIEAENDDKKLQEILNSFADGSLFGYISRYRKDEKRIFMYLSSVLRQAGFYPYAHLAIFVEKLKTTGIPYREINIAKERSKHPQIYHIVFDKHKQRIIDVLKDDPDLQKFKENPVILVCGDSDGIIPNTTELTKKEKYSSVGPLIMATIRLRIANGSRINMKDFLSGCPVPIYKYRSHKNFLYPLERKEELIAFIKSRWNMFPQQKT